MEKKKRILDVALKLFVENGFHGTTTSKIAFEAGVANGTLFQCYKTKDELIVAIYMDVKNEMANCIAKDVVASKTFKEEMKTQLLSSLFWALDNRNKFHYIQQFQTSPYLGKVEKRILNEHLEPHLTLIKKGIKLGIIKPLPVDLIYSIISGHVFGLYQFITSRKLTSNKQQETIETTFEMLWDMLT